jgi:hypothetical protein
LRAALGAPDQEVLKKPLLRGIAEGSGRPHCAEPMLPTSDGLGDVISPVCWPPHLYAEAACSRTDR